MNSCFIKLKTSAYIDEFMFYKIKRIVPVNEVMF